MIAPAEEHAAAVRDDDECDVLVVGGGPAGSTAAAILAAGGRDVLLVEKDAHPRFHIGESLLPQNMELLGRLGIADEVASIGVLKPGAEFVADDTGRSVAFDFTHSLLPSAGHAYQVPRAEFDRLVFEVARARGARVLERTRATAMEEGGGGRLLVTVAGPDGAARRLRPRFVLDASGRDTFLTERAGGKVADKRNSTAAVFSHFRGVERRAGALAGYITVHLVDDGWFWMIPLPGDVMSVGFVGNQSAFKARHGTREALFEERLRTSPTVAARMAGAERIGPVCTTGNYSYRARTSFGDRWMMIGDAFGFIDPVFSSGVMLAMSSAERGAAIASAWLDDPIRGAAMAGRNEREVRAAMDRIGWMIYRINTPAFREMFMSPSNRLRMRDAVISLLCGHIWPDSRMQVPLLAFKGVYHALGVLRRVRPRQIPAPRLAPGLVR